ncbi:hypothetical protein ACL9RI_23250 [Janthinobacterium sp. Mn2066]|uniref:hypothetical protein n=1 Tax=Janthinobacterium sp. Mn2066 TaxID=3395264 RepID=UPI003BC39514
MVKLKYCIWAGYFFAPTKKTEKETNPYAINNLPHGKVMHWINFTMPERHVPQQTATPWRAGKRGSGKRRSLPAPCHGAGIGAGLAGS